MLDSNFERKMITREKEAELSSKQVVTTFLDSVKQQNYDVIISNIYFVYFTVILSSTNLFKKKKPEREHSKVKKNHIHTTIKKTKK